MTEQVTTDVSADTHVGHDHTHPDVCMDFMERVTALAREMGLCPCGFTSAVTWLSFGALEELGNPKATLATANEVLNLYARQTVVDGLDTIQ
jgi:hypothetical protein